MAEKKFLDQHGLAILANNINTRLKTVTELPTEGVEAGLTRLYIGASGNGLLKGHMYQSVETEGQIGWTDITPVAAVPLAVKGTISAEDLKALDLKNIEPGWMYNISDDFETDGSFVNEGVFEKAGSNVYCIEIEQGEGDNKTTVKKWDVFAVFVTDQQYNPESTNAQSGVAVAEALDAVTKVADEGLDEKLDKRYEMPESAPYGFVTAYVGETDEQFKEGHIYKADIKISVTDKDLGGIANKNPRSQLYIIGDNLYCYNSNYSYKINRTENYKLETSDIANPSFTSNLDPRYIWADGEDTYYSSGSSHAVLNKLSKRWEIVNNWPSFYGSEVIITDNGIYVPGQSEVLIFNKRSSNWLKETVVNRLIPENNTYNPTNFWTDGSNIYYTVYNSSGNSSADSYIFDKKTVSWVKITWKNLPKNFYGNRTWMDSKGNRYATVAVSSTYENYILNKSSYSWQKVPELKGYDCANYYFVDKNDTYYIAGNNSKAIDFSNNWCDLTADSDPTDAIPDSEITSLLD